MSHLLPTPRAPTTSRLIPPTMHHPPSLPCSLHPEHSAEMARQWAAYQENGPRPGEWADATQGDIIAMVIERHLARRQRVLGLREQPAVNRWCVPVDGSVSLQGEGGSVVVGERKGLERLTRGLPSVPVPRQDARIREFCGWVQRWGKPKQPDPPGQSEKSAQPSKDTPAAMVNDGGAHGEWIHITQENYKQSSKGSRQMVRPSTKLKNSLAHRPQISGRKSMTKAACTVYRPARKNFMDLPLELREFVYHYIFVGIRWGHPAKRSRNGVKFDTYALAILRLSKNIWTEAHSYFLEHMEWDFVADNRGIDHLEYMATAPKTSLRNISRANLIVEANATRVNGQVGLRLGRALCCISSLHHIRVEIQRSRRSHYVARDHDKDLQDRLRDSCFERYLIGSFQEHMLDVLPPGWVTHKTLGRGPDSQSIIYLRKDSN
ncbi:hypothetical protein MMC17_004441 [Xylographa soralifera]|nr:hypothetical protein [Xylographa soralifera]